MDFVGLFRTATAIESCHGWLFCSPMFVGILCSPLFAGLFCRATAIEPCPGLLVCCICIYTYKVYISTYVVLPIMHVYSLLLWECHFLILKSQLMI